MEQRKVTYRMYPTAKQEEALLDTLGLHQRLYNTALEARIRAYKDESQSLTFASQCRDLTQWRARVPALAAMNAQSQQVTLDRLDKAYKAFFRRVKAGEKAGFPRFKPIQRYPGWGYKKHGDGWRLLAGQARGRKQMAHGKLRLSGIGVVKLRGAARAAGEPKICEILHRNGKWYASVTLNCEPTRVSGSGVMAFDWGLEQFATVVDGAYQTHTEPNPRFMDKTQRAELKTLQQAVARKTNKRSHNRKKAVAKVAKLHSKIARQRLDFHHQLAAKWVKNNALIATEQLNVKGMSANGGEYKKGLNREILSAAPAQFLIILECKAAEAGIQWIEVPTRQVKPSQTCHRCGAQRKKSLNERRHVCPCGTNCGRDENAARVMLNWALTGKPAVESGQELAEVWSGSRFAAMKHETPSVPVLAGQGE